MRRRPLIALLWAAAVMLGGMLAVGPHTTAHATGTPVPGVLDYTATAGGLELHIIPGEYRGTLDQALVETTPYVNAQADSSPSTAATAGVINTAAMNHYPDLVCLLAPAYYCPYAQALPGNTFFARAYSGTPTESATTSFPCHPGEQADHRVVLAPPDCSRTGAVPSLADGQAHASTAPAVDTKAIAHLGSTTLPSAVNGSPPAATVAGVTTVTEMSLDPDSGAPIARSLVAFLDVEVAGVFHADAIRLETSAETLGQPTPKYSARTELSGVTIENAQDPSASLRQQGTRQCNDQLAALYDSALKQSGLLFYCSRLNPPGDPRYHGHSAPIVDTDPNTGYGLNPVSLELQGPGFDYVQGTNDYKGPAPPCLDLDSPGRSVPKPLPQPSSPPATQMPVPQPPPGTRTPVPPPPYLPPPAAHLGTSCDYVSSNTFRGNNGLSLRFGHITQFLAAGANALSAAGGGSGGYTLGEAVGLAGAAASEGVASGSGGYGSSAGGTPSTGSATAPDTHAPLLNTGSRLETVVAGVTLRRWLLYGYGAWGTLTTAMLALWALRIPRRLGGGL
jgi:hypothetical protein